MGKNRKLKKKEVMIVSRILEDINFKYYVDSITKTNKLDIMTEGKNKENAVLTLFVDIVAYLMQNMNHAEENIDELLRSYKKMSQEEVEDMDVDEYVDTLKHIFISGVPKVVEDMIDLTEVKKKLETLKE